MWVILAVFFTLLACLYFYIAVNASRREQGTEGYEWQNFGICFVAACIFWWMTFNLTDQWNPVTYDNMTYLNPLNAIGMLLE
tara:strand:+ start:2514 stop:2759 length:246 start_codon:yes stop_codon:yes gene_type:complete